MGILNRFLNYISFETTSDETKDDTPSSEKELVFAKYLYKEMKSLGVSDFHFDQNHCYLYGILRGNSDLPSIGFITHMDTSSDAKGNNINAQIIRNYNGESIKYASGNILDINTNPDLKNHIGKTLITSDGFTLLGADDKAGIAEVLSSIEYFASSNEEHGDIYVCITPDEEIGLGTKHINYDYFKPDYAFTVDGSFLGEFNYENFNAATFNINIKGVGVHLGFAKDKLVNALKIAVLLNSFIPDEAPENTEGKEGYFHLRTITGDYTNVDMIYDLRDFDTKGLENRKKVIIAIINKLNEKYNNAITYNIVDRYKNMYEKISIKPEIIEKSLIAYEKAGIKPEVVPIRGGTDGARISYDGMPCPNICAGGHNFHSIYEYIALEDMEKITDLLINFVREFTINNKLQK